MNGAPDYAALKEMAQTLRRPATTLIALSHISDPFYVTPSRRELAEWFATQWRNLGLKGKSGIHLRRIHYLLVSLETSVRLPNGTLYQNLHECWSELIVASRDARYLRLVPPSAFIDRRSEEPIVAIAQSDSRPSIYVTHDGRDLPTALPRRLPHIPQLTVTPPSIRQRYLIEIWVEKSTINEIVLPLHQRFDVNVVTGVGELSDVRCQDLVERAIEDGRPVRVLYVSDFDPGGMSMPVAVARKIEHRLRTDGLKLDIQVRPVLLTHAQTIEYQVPRIPLKETERRAALFEERFGEGATELDALEALHPGEIRRILEREILRYYDSSLRARITRVTAQVERDLSRINTEVETAHGAVIEQLEAEYAALNERYQAGLAGISERFESLQHAVRNSLYEVAPNPSGYDWPEPEDPDPLFDSTRDYVTQIDRYKLHQGKPTARRKRSGPLLDLLSEGNAT